MIKKSFAATPSKPSIPQGHTLTFLANSGEQMSTGEAVDLQTLKVPLSDGTFKTVGQLKDDDPITVPLLLDHMPSIQAQAGTITRLWLTDDGLMATARLSDVESGKLVQQLAQDQNLTNSFSLGIYGLEPGDDHTFHDAELEEISVVFRGADGRAVFKSLNSRSHDMGKKIDIDTSAVDKTLHDFNLSKDEADKLSSAINTALQGAAQQISDAVADQTEGDDDTDDEDTGTDGTKSGDDGSDPQPPQPTTSDNSRQGGQHMPVIINTRSKGKVRQTMAHVKSERETYLDSPKAFDDFANYLWAHPTDAPAKGVIEGWNTFARKQLGEHATMGIDNDSVETLIPKSVVTTINDELNTRGSGLWGMFAHTGIDTPPKLGENEVSLDADDGRAHGYPVEKYGTEKQQERIAIRTRDFGVGMVYKYLQLNRGDIRRTGNPSQLLRFALQDLPNRLIQTVERAAVLNKTDPAANDWADMNMFRSVIDDSTETQEAAGSRVIPGNKFALTRQAKAGESLIETFRRAAGMVKAAGAKVLITTDEVVSDIALSKDSNGNFLLPLGSDTAAAVSVSQIITPQWYLDRDREGTLGVIMVPSQYAIWGDSDSESFTNFKLSTNTNEFLEEIWTGGGLRTIKSAVVVKPYVASGGSATRAAKTATPAAEG